MNHIHKFLESKSIMWCHNHKFFLATSLTNTLVIILSLTNFPISLAQNSRQDIVDAHNAVRSQVGVGPLVWNKTVAAYTQRYANSRVPDCTLEHSIGKYGENIAEGYGDLTGINAVAMWASEKPHYDYDTNSCVGDECHHYTQVVWRGSVHLGCGRARCDNGWVFVICNDEPAGNFIGERPY